MFDFIKRGYNKEAEFPSPSELWEKGENFLKEIQVASPLPEESVRSHYDYSAPVDGIGGSWKSVDNLDEVPEPLQNAYNAYLDANKWLRRYSESFSMLWSETNTEYNRPHTGAEIPKGRINQHYRLNGEAYGGQSAHRVADECQEHLSEFQSALTRGSTELAEYLKIRPSVTEDDNFRGEQLSS